MKLTLTMFLTLFLFTSCGEVQDEETKPSFEYEPLSDSKIIKLNTDQLLRSQRICSAVTSKRLMIFNDLVGITKQFALRQQQGDCSSKTTEPVEVRVYVESPRTLTERILFKPLYSNSKTIGPLSEVITDKSSLLSSFCKSIIDSDIPLNLVREDGINYLYIFPENEEGAIEVISYLKRDDGEFYPARLDRMVVNLSKGKNKGFLSSRTTGSYCANNRDIITYFRQDVDFL